jgi:tetratricopeptide (TPR) repeat protein
MTKKTPWPIEPRNEQVEYMLMLDSVNYARMGDKRDRSPIAMQALAEMCDEPTTAEEINSLLNKTYDDAAELWHKFVWLCNEGQAEDAIKLYRNNPLIVDLALADSDVRLAFHDEVLGFLAYDNLPADEARELMIGCFQFDFAMIGIQLAATCEEDRYSEHYNYAFQMLDTLLEQTDHYVDMITYIDSWAETLNGVRYHPSIDVNAFTRKGFVYEAIGDYEKAITSYSEAKRLLEQAIADGENDPSLTNWIEMLNQSIDACNVAMN